MALNFFKKLDITLLAVVIILILLGLIIIFSTSYNSTGTDFLNFKKQAIFSVIGLILMIAASLFDYRALKNWTGIFYILSCFILVAILFSGTLIRGSTSWFDLGFFNVQPSEFIKIIMIVILAKYLSEAKNYLNDFKKIIISGIYISLPTILIIFQPDFGSALVILFIWIAMIFITGTKMKYMAMIFVFGLILFVGSWFYVFEDYQKDRIATFINPQSDLLGSGYNVNQSIIAVGSGNVWGKGLGHGSQSQLNFLPEKHTDFIFAVVAEEMGFIGVFLMLGLFAIVFYRLFKIAVETQDNFGKLLILGVAFTLIFHITINIGMNVGIMPVTGIPLPFISYGGSSLISFLIMIGVVQSVYMRGRGYRIEKEED
jgi:rod shape determining protein RodA